MNDDIRIRKRIASLVDVISRLVIPIYRYKGKIPEQIGSGFFIKAGTETILVSAAHVINRCKNEELFFYVSPNTTRRITGYVKATDETDSDVAMVFFKEEPYPPFYAVDKQITPFKYLSPNRIPRENKYYIIVGFPSTKSKTKHNTNETEVQVYAYHDYSIPENEYERLNLSPMDRIALPLNLKKNYDSELNLVHFPKPQGMSGSPIWELFDNNFSELDYSDSLHLVGIGIEYHSQKKLLVGADISCALAMLKDA
tara:strand:- start:1169 stop:1933 length:765 start_codon:yes stop_codon:yes gene_type:complete